MTFKGPDPKPVKAPRDQKPLRARPKPRTDAQVADSVLWAAAVSRKRTSTLWAAEDYDVIAADGSPRVHLHHIVSRQECRKHGVPEWDPRNGVPVSERRHARHHSRVEPLHRAELPDEIYAFLAEYPALQPYFNRMYGAGS